ncbi:hypothetical protein GOQ27_07870 [Clostridium sp. D2Q-11]|uniref:Uncharacterized protein n=1 Tax=Anaeromonas frigoriresistens TaxID=2683708 RepID=A0A942UTN9_9FIRM|nr:hypothetical protein [Anaeromonas frigoriresistens]MBS4538378.1 hypothetical protein [Anaeromonas frigoriresistens]
MINPILIMGIVFMLIGVVFKIFVSIFIFYDIFLSEKIKFKKGNIENIIKKVYIISMILGIILMFIGYFIFLINA